MSLFKNLPFVDPRANTYAARLADKLASRPSQFLGALPEERLLDKLSDVPDSIGHWVLVSSDPWQNMELNRARMKRERANQCAAFIQVWALRWLFQPEGPMVRRAVREMALDTAFADGATAGEKGAAVNEANMRRIPAGANDVQDQPRADGEGSLSGMQEEGREK